RRSEAPGHQTVETPSVRETPQTAHGRTAVVQRVADPVELAAIELPTNHAVDVAAERDFLNGHVDVLSETGPETRIPRGHRARRGHHVRVKRARVERLLDRRPVRLARQAQSASHRG